MYNGTNNKLINLVVHDSGDGIADNDGGSDNEIYGNLIYHNGWIAPDRGHGQGIYAQNTTGYKQIYDNIMFSGFNQGMQIYGSPAASLNNFDIEGNIVFNTGMLEGWYDRGMLVGGEGVCLNPIVAHNYGYFTPYSAYGPGEPLDVGYGGNGTTNPVVQNNYLSSTVLLQYNQNLTLTGNTFVGAMEIDGNTPSNNFAAYPGNINIPYGTQPTGVVTFVRPNKYEPGRANIAIFNWDGDAAVNVDVSSALTPGASYVVQDVQNYFGPPVTSGVYLGGTISIPMTSTTIVAPVGTGYLTYFHTTTQFGSFILLTVNSGPAPPTVSAGANQTITLPATASLSGTASPGGAGTLTTLWSEASGPAAVSFANASALNTTVSFSQSGTYVLTLTATSGSLSANSGVTITVNPAPTPPTVSAGSNQTITLPSTASLSGTASPGNAGTLTTLWSEASGPAAVTFANASALSTTVSFSQSGTYVLTLTATSGSLSANSGVTITVNPAPTPPTVSAGSNQTITLPSTASLSGTASPGNAGTLTTLWSVVSGPGAATFTNPSSVSTTAAFSLSGTYVLKLTATSGTLSASSNVTITVNPVPTPPTVSAGGNQTVTLPATASLSGTASPGNAGTLTTLWSKASGPAAVTFANASALNTTVSFSQSGTYVLTLTATSGSLSANSNVTMTVNAALQFTPIRVAAGGPAYTDTHGNIWSADTGFLGSTSSTWNVTNAITGTSDPNLYQNERWGQNMTPVHYQFAVPNGTYTVNLKFAELFYAAPRQRLFNIVLNGQTVLSNFDEFAAAGGEFIATDHAFSVTASNGLIDIQLLPFISNPTICAIEIVPSTGAPLASAGSNQTITLPATASLSGTASPGSAAL